MSAQTPTKAVQVGAAAGDEMLDKKFEGRKNIYFEFEGEVTGLVSKSEFVRSENGGDIYGVRARDYAHACQIDKLLADSGKEYEVRG